MSFRDEVNNTTRSVMIETFITSIFKDEHRRFGDILEDLIELDDPDDDWMKDTLYDLEVGQFVRAGMKVLGLAQGERGIEWVLGESDPDSSEYNEDDGSDESFNEDEGVLDEESESEEREYVESESDSTDASDGEEDSEPKPKKKKRKKKKPKNAPKRRKKKVMSVKARRQSRESDDEQDDYLKLILKALRSAKAYDEDTAVNNRYVLDHVHGEGNHGDEEGASFRAGIKELEKRGKVTKVGQRRGTRYHLN